MDLPRDLSRKDEGRPDRAGRPSVKICFYSVNQLCQRNGDRYGRDDIEHGESKFLHLN